MEKPSVYSVKKYLAAINKIKAKYITVEKLSKEVGIYPDVIADNLAYFEPLIKMDDTFDVLDIVDKMKEYVKPKEKINKLKEETAVKVSKKEVLAYQSVNDFVYQKYTIGGFLNRSTKLTKEDLVVLSKLVKKELKK